MGTPPGEDGSADLQHVLAVAETIGKNMPPSGPEKIVITKSTVPVGTAAKVRQGVGTDGRIGSSFLFAGIGYGGSCFPKDVKALVHMLRQEGVDSSILDGVEQVNAKQKSLLLQKVEERYGEDLSGRVFAVWGLSFKPETDDMREAPSLTIVRGLAARGAKVKAHDPEAHHEAERHFAELLAEGALELCERNYDCLEGADALLVLTESSPYRRPDFERIRSRLREPVVFDGRNLWAPERMRESGFQYYSVGRRSVAPLQVVEVEAAR